MPGFDTSHFELVGTGDFPEVLRQRAGVALALRDERNPVVVGFVFKANLDVLRNFRRERFEVLAVIVVDVGIDNDRQYYINREGWLDIAELVLSSDELEKLKVSDDDG